MSIDWPELLRLVVPNLLGLLVITALMGAALAAVRSDADDRPHARHFVLLLSLAGVGAVVLGSLGARLVFTHVWVTDAATPRTVIFVVATTWLVGLAILFVRLALGFDSVRRMRRDSSCWPASTDQSAAIQHCAWRVGLTHAPPVLFCPGATVPMVVGLRSPVVLLPPSLDGADEAELRLVLLHEFAHVRRRDSQAELLIQVVGGLLWWHPLYWLTASRLRVLREMACDEVAAFGGYPRETYAKLLIRFAVPSLLPFCSSFASVRMADKASLRARLNHLAAPRTEPGWSKLPWVPPVMSNAATARFVFGAVAAAILLDAVAANLLDGLALTFDDASSGGLREALGDALDLTPYVDRLRQSGL